MLTVPMWLFVKLLVVYQNSKISLMLRLFMKLSHLPADSKEPRYRVARFYPNTPLKKKLPTCDQTLGSLGLVRVKRGTILFKTVLGF